MTSIFQIDWITVDIIIIILLVLLLFGVKIFKSTHRWRYSFSNQALEQIRFSQVRRKDKNQTISIKKGSLTINSIFKNNERDIPLILILRTNRKRRLLRVFTEGLCSYGFSVINIKAKIKHKSDKIPSEKDKMDDWKSLISIIFDGFNKIETLRKLKYILIEYSKPVIFHEKILSDSNIKGVILINPKQISKKSLEHNKISKNKSINNQIYRIFSKKSLFVFRNKSLKKYLQKLIPQNDDSIKPLTINKATSSFKYYETIMLSMLIDIIENKILKIEP